MIKFQEKNAQSKYDKKVFQVVKKRSKFKSRSSTVIDDLVVNDKLGPKRFSSLKAELDERKTEAGQFYNDYFLWLILRHDTGADKLFPNFAAWRLAKRKQHDVSFQETVVTYLPPINASVNSFSTIYQYLQYMQKLCNEVNMPYVNVTLDCGAAVNAYKLVWNYPAVFDNVIIHLGDFHFMKDIFTVLGKLIRGSGFEEIIFQSKLSTSGSLNDVLSGSHYNRCWRVHEHFAEALE